MDTRPTTTVTYSTEDMPYRSAISPRNFIISRTSYPHVGLEFGVGPRSAGGVSVTRSYTCSPAYDVTLTGVADVKLSTDGDRKDMQV